MKSVIFVCLGNICRSSLAEGVAKRRVKALGLDIGVDSAGISRYHNGESPCTISIRLAEKNNIDISEQTSQHISEFDLLSYDLVIALDESNKEDLLRLGLKNIKKLGDFGFKGKDVADLYYYPEKEKEVWNMLSVAVDEIIEEVA